MTRTCCFLTSATLGVVAWLGLLSAGEVADPAPANRPAGLDPDTPYTARKSNAVTYEVDYRVVVTAPYHTRTLKVWVPLPQSDAGQEVEPGEITTFPMRVEPETAREKVFGNQFAYLEFDHPEGAQIIRHRFKVKVWELHWDVDPARVSRVSEWPAGFDCYLKSDRAVLVDDRFRKAASDIVGESKGTAEDLGEVMDWLQKNMKYDHSRASLKASSEHALLNMTGHCSDYHGLCAAFGRALGVPTRVTYGLNTFLKNSPSHCKMEAFLPPYGWVSFDVSETQKLIQSIQAAKGLSRERREALIQVATERLRGGFRDNTWFVQTRGTDYDLAPKASQRVNVVRTIYAEADGQPLPDPDPADPNKNQFAWMTAIDFKPDREAAYPFKGWDSLLPTDK